MLYLADIGHFENKFDNLMISVLNGAKFLHIQNVSVGPIEEDWRSPYGGVAFEAISNLP